MECNFTVGQKVVCVHMDRDYPEGVEPVDEPIKPQVGKVYTVREILTGKVGNSPCIKVVEIPDHMVGVRVSGEYLIGDVVYDAVGFRPLVERKTDISVFKAMLNPSKEQVSA